MASRELKDLTVAARKKCERFLAICKIMELPAFITCTLRTNEEQLEVYLQGRKHPGKVVTNAKPGESMHNPDPEEGKSRAFDIAFRPEDDPSGATWDGPWKTVGQIGRLVGLRWGGTFKTRVDQPHFEDTA